MKGIKLALLVSVLCVSIGFTSYASHGELGGGTSESLPWETVKKSLDAVMTVTDLKSYGYSESEIINEACKEADYLLYICTSHQQDYDTYYHYASHLSDIFNNSGYAYFIVLDEDTYNGKLKATKKFSNFKKIDATMIADSGFRADVNGLPFYNPTVKGLTTTSDVTTFGCCGGMSWFSIQNYVNGYKKITFNHAKKYLQDNYGSAVKVTDWTVDLSDIKEVTDKKLYNYKPVSKDLKAKMAPRGKTEKDAELKALGFSMIDLETIKNTKDYKLLKAIALSSYTAFQIANEGGNELWNQCNYEDESLIKPCPASEIFEIEKEFKKGKPVYVIMDNGKFGTHAIVGYALAKDKKQSNKYYIYAYNNNNPGNYGLTGTEKSDYYWIEVVTEKGIDGNEYAFYEFREVKTPTDEAAYASAGGALISRYTGNFEFLSADGVRLHCYTSADKFGERCLTSYTGKVY